MITIRKSLCVLFVVWSFCHALVAQEIVISVNNPSDFSRYAEIVEVNVSDLLQYKGITEFGSCIVTNDSGRVIPSQIVTAQLPATKIHLLFQSDFPARGSKQFRIAFVSGAVVTDSTTPGVTFDAKAGLRWRNSIADYQITGLVKNAALLPIFKPNFQAGIEDTVLFNDNDQSGIHSLKSTYEKLFSWPALGAGAGSLMVSDSLISNSIYQGYKILTNGPLRTSFEMYFTLNLNNAAVLHETLRISLDADCQFNSVTVFFAPDTLVNNTKLLFATGLSKNNAAIRFTDKEGSWMSVWHPSVITTGNGSVGMALYVPKKYNPVPIESSDNYIITGRVVYPGTFRYYWGCAIAGNGETTNEASWRERFLDFVKRKKEPLTILLEN